MILPDPERRLHAIDDKLHGERELTNFMEFLLREDYINNFLL